MRMTNRWAKSPEGVGFEPTVSLIPRSISSRVPSTGLSHPSFFSHAGFATRAEHLILSRRRTNLQSPIPSAAPAIGVDFRGGQMTNEAVKSNGGQNGLRGGYWLFCAVIVVLAVFLRAPAMRSGLPYIDYVDEGYVLHQTIDLLNHRSLDTRWYGYPSLPAYLTTVTLIAYSPIYHLRHGHGFRQDLPDDQSIHTPDGDNYDLISPPELIVAGRFVTVCLSVGTVVLAGAIATLLAGQRAGLLAMMITAVCPALVARASNVIVDTFATFFALLALYFCDSLQRADRKNHYSSRWSAVFAGLAAGLAFASKYTVAVVFAAVV